MKYIPYILLFTLIACKQGESKALTPKTAPKTAATTVKESIPTVDYTSFKQAVLLHKGELKTATPDSIAAYLYTLLNKDIYGYWKGRPWDFNGRTQNPAEGAIACGYFVTNTLSDLGFKIQRTKLAQVVSSEMIKTLCVGIKSFSQLEQLRNYLAQQPDHSVYIIGLDFHTGYILKDASGTYFMHSNYINRSGVTKERIEESAALAHSKSFMIGSLSANTARLKQWVNDF